MKQNNDNRENGKIEAADISLSEKSPFFKWLDNFWYHYKWPFIVVVFFLAVIVICVAQALSSTEPDSTFTFAGPTQLTNEEKSAIKADVTSLLENDKNNDGQKLLDMMTFSVYSEDEFKKANEEETDENGDFVPTVNSSYNASNYEEFSEYTGTGNCSVYLVSEYLYKNLKNGDRLRSLSDVFDNNLPTGALSDGYGVRLGDTDFYKFFDSVKVLPEDTVICLVRPYVWGESSNKASYAASEDLFKNIVNFKIQ